MEWGIRSVSLPAAAAALSAAGDDAAAHEAQLRPRAPKAEQQVRQ